MLMRRYHNKGYKPKKKAKAKTVAAYKRAEAEVLTKEQIDELAAGSLVAKFRLSDLAGANTSPIRRIGQVISARNKFYRQSGASVNRHVTALSVPNDKAARKRMDEILTVIARRARKLLQPEYYKAALVLAKFPPQKPVADFRPKYKGAERTWREFVRHYVAGDYEVPEFFFKVLATNDRPEAFFNRLIETVRGGSVYALRDHLSLPLTKRMVRSLWEDEFSHAHWVGFLRAAQLRTLGAGFEFILAVNAGFFGSSYGNVAEEEFRFSVLQWLVNNLDESADIEQIGPIIDYVRGAYNEDPKYTMKGRTRRTLLRDVDVWHRNLKLGGDVYRATYKPSGYTSGDWLVKNGSNAHDPVLRAISVTEVLTSQDLLAEGRTHNHCVFSYHREVMNGKSSIWSLRSNGQRAVTIEVKSGAIVQARGKYNRMPKDWEKEYIRRWASQNQLHVRWF